MLRQGQTRLPLIILTALFVNVFLFTMIELMVGSKRVRLTETSDFNIANFIRMQEQSREVRSRREPDAPQKPQQEMQQDLQRLSETSTGGSIGFSVDMPEIDIDLGGGIQIARELTPMVRIPPEYPIIARQRQIGGFVDLRFTVTETGSVADPEVLRASPAGVFERAARRAVLRWKYQPQMVDGKPVAVVTYTRIIFEMLPEDHDR